jgi:hypothetical protein
VSVVALPHAATKPCVATGSSTRSAKSPRFKQAPTASEANPRSPSPPISTATTFPTTRGRSSRRSFGRSSASSRRRLRTPTAAHSRLSTLSSPIPPPATSTRLTTRRTTRPSRPPAGFVHSPRRYRQRRRTGSEEGPVVVLENFVPPAKRFIHAGFVPSWVRFVEDDALPPVTFPARLRRGWRWLFPSPRLATFPRLPRFLWHLAFPPDTRPGVRRPRQERRRDYLTQREAAIEDAAVAGWEATATPDQKAVAAERDALLDAIARGVLARGRHRDADTGMKELDLTPAAIATGPRERPRERRGSSTTRRSSSGSSDSDLPDPPSGRRHGSARRRRMNVEALLELLDGVRRNGDNAPLTWARPS